MAWHFLTMVIKECLSIVNYKWSSFDIFHCPSIIFDRDLWTVQIVHRIGKQSWTPYWIQGRCWADSRAIQCPLIDSSVGVSTTSEDLLVAGDVQTNRKEEACADHCCWIVTWMTSDENFTMVMMCHEYRVVLINEKCFGQRDNDAVVGGDDTIGTESWSIEGTSCDW